MKYFITGATGFIGGRLAHQLREAGHDVIAVVRNPAKAQDLAQLGVTLYQGDVTEKESMRKPMTGVDGVFHVAGWYKVGVRDKSQAVAINVEGTRNVLELMKELNIPKGVYTSTLAVNSDTHGVEADENYHFTGKHISVYDQTKAGAHDVAVQMIKEGLPLVIVQPGLVYGPGDTSSVRTSLIQYLTKQLPVMPKQTAFSWAHVDDIAHAHWLAMEKGKSARTTTSADQRTPLSTGSKSQKKSQACAYRWPCLRACCE
ncbi:NAD-dependent epimerase/dehydratase family protein [Candidatus Villigracilis proximus]|uniref:NAD-dependent epimerase/dehydratase family protein n=1 Tax=Candidatus Villigracilis proximus TaxID=3140683 RepID=UPI0031EEBD95